MKNQIISASHNTIPSTCATDKASTSKFPTFSKTGPTSLNGLQNRSWLARTVTQALLLGVLCLSFISFVESNSYGQNKYSPSHPEVRELVAKGVAYLRKPHTIGPSDQIIVALAVLNSYQDYGFVKDELVVAGVNSALGMVPTFRQYTGKIQGNTIPGLKTNDRTYNRMYEACVALMLLVEYDDQKYDAEIRDLIDFIVARQSMQIGGWTYNSDKGVGDSSQTQYCCLALWIAKKKGFEIPIEHASAAARFWTSTQAANGTWAYKCRPGVREGSNALSLTCAGAGSLYMLGDILSVNKKKKNTKIGKGKKAIVLPGFVKKMTMREIEQLLNKEKDEPKQNKPDIDGALLTSMRGCKSKCQGWFKSNYAQQLKDNAYWTKYALYGFERYATFREEIDGEVSEMPNWYDQGIEYVKKQQKEDGSWGPDGDEAGLHAQTALTILFMVRSTKRLTQSIQNAGLKASDKGFGEKVSVRGGKVISANEQKDLDEVLSQIAKGQRMSPEDQTLFYESLLATVQSSVKGKPKGQQLILLRSLVNEPKAAVRKIGVRILGQTRLMDNCPALIYALTDPNPEVVEETITALQFVSRKTNVPEMPTAKLYLANKEEYTVQQKAAYKYWSKWYLELDPEAILLEVGPKWD